MDDETRQLLQRAASRLKEKMGEVVSLREQLKQREADHDTELVEAKLMAEKRLAQAVAQQAQDHEEVLSQITARHGSNVAQLEKQLKAQKVKIEALLDTCRRQKGK